MPSQKALHNEEAINQQQEEEQDMKVLSTYKRLSLWLIPPEPILSSLSCTQKQLISLHMSDQHDNNKKAPLLLPTFIPHITLVGGVPISECCSMEDDVLPQLLSLQQQRQEVNHPSKTEDDFDDNSNSGNQLFTIIDIDELAAQSVLKRLQCAFSNFGGVSCNFVKERGVFAATRKRQRQTISSNDESTLIDGGIDDDTHKMNDDDKDSDGKEDDKEGQIIDEVQWNQSCIAIMERSAEFINAMEVADKALFSHRYNKSNGSSSNKDGHYDGRSSSLERHFKPPSCEPHYSFVYGNDASLIQSLSERSSINSSNNISDGSDERSDNRDLMILECPPNFTSTEIIVMWTYPSTLEGVEQWREIGRFSLV